MRGLNTLRMKLLAAMFYATLVLFVMVNASCAENPAGEPSDHLKTQAPIAEFLFIGDAFDTTFLQPTVAHREWSPARWKEEFLNMSRIGIKSLVVQWSQYDRVSFVAGRPGQDSLLQRIMAAAEETNLDMYVGLSLSQAWMKPQDLNLDLMRTELEENRALSQQIYPQLKSYQYVRGWYIPQELTDLFYVEPQRELILRFFAELTAHLRQLDPTKLVLASGYTSPAQNHLTRFKMWWMRVFDETGIDVLIFQDAAGTVAQGSWQAMYPYLEAISMIDDEYFSGDVWFLAEVFTQVDGPDVNNKPFRAVPADFKRVKQQLEMLSRFGKHMVSYSYFPYMQTGGEPDAEVLYEAYRAYVQDIVSANLQP